MGNWLEWNVTRSFRHFGLDANNLLYNGFYAWGSTDNVTNVMPDTSVGIIQHIPRDDNTKYQIGIRYSDNAVYTRVCKNGTWEEWKRLAFASEIPDMPTGTVTPKMVYQRGAYDSGDATERIIVYIPFNGKYVAYYLYHYVKTAIKCNCWRIMSAYRENDILATEGRAKLTANGEWECAIRQTGKDDYTGGSTHGNEELTGDYGDFVVLLNGKDITDSLTADYTSTNPLILPFENLRIIRRTNMYEFGTTDSPITNNKIAEHGCEYYFDGTTKLQITQSLQWKAAVSLMRAYMAMFTPSKDYTQYVYTDRMQTLYYCPDAVVTGATDAGATRAVIYGTGDSGAVNMTAEFGIEKYPTGLSGGDKWSLTDNRDSTYPDGHNYNKMYYHITASHQTTIDELWKSITTYKIDA